MNRTILIVAFHFPPVATSSGMQRALKAVRYLREDGWLPVVLTVDPRAYDKTNPSQLHEIPDDVVVHRAFGVDARRLCSIRNRYPGFLAWPDAWLSWWPAAVHAGKRLIRRHEPRAIWSTFPISTTKLVALRLSRWSGLPWVADFRDPMTLDGYPPDPMRFRLARRIEQRTVGQASRAVFTADYTRRIYAERYPELADRFLVIPNGYDEANFPELITSERRRGGPITLLHSGALQPKARNPRSFFEALGKIVAKKAVGSSELRVVFRACGFEDLYKKSAADAGVSDLVHFEDHLPYDAAIREMVAADALLVFQGTAYNHAVPAKLYEYFFAKKPILGVLDKNGETQSVLTQAGVRYTASIDDADEIAGCLEKLVGTLDRDSPFLPEPDSVHEYSRRNQVRKLSVLLHEVVDAAELGGRGDVGGRAGSVG